MLFGPFEFEVASQRLLENGQTVPSGSRALDLLSLLVRRAGELVSKEALVAHVWPNTCVDDSNIRTQICSLRRMLRDGEDGRRFITTVPGRGYRFVAGVRRRAAPAGTNGATIGRLPLRLTTLIGREGTLAALKTRLERGRLVTLVGHGGVGKTATALTFANDVAAQFEDGALFADMTSVADGAQGAHELAAILGLAPSNCPALALSNFFERRHALLVLDGCENGTDVIASVVEFLLKTAPGLSILVTSRERLRAEGEAIEHIGNLAVPGHLGCLKAAEAINYPAVQALVEYMSSIDSAFSLTDANAPLVGGICARLDGLPLALELAAGRVEQFGIAEVARHLDQPLDFLVQGQRTAPDRQRSLRANVDWSYDKLADHEKALLRGLSIFEGSFSLAAAAHVTGCFETYSQTVGGIASLVSKSLVMRDFNPRSAEYRLAGITRAFAVEKLIQHGEYAAVADRYAGFRASSSDQAIMGPCE